MALSSVQQTTPQQTTSQLLSQGAEARIYKYDFLGYPAVIKERFSKGYRHPTLDKSLTMHRIKAEVRCMVRCRMYGIPTPVVYDVDMQNGKIHMQYIADSQTVKEYIRQLQSPNHVASEENAAEFWLGSFARTMGYLVALMHSKNIIHGDLTTSNMLLVGRPLDMCLHVIDFGLGSLEGTAEDKAVDLYVLERALLSSHPNTESVFSAIIVRYSEVYKSNVNKKAADEILSKLEEVRLRGRKRTMVG